jgi:hypothetical protein
MNCHLPFALIAASLVLFLTPRAQSADALDADVYGSYSGFLRASGAIRYSSAFQLSFTPTLQLSVNYRIRRISVREVYQFSNTGSFVGTARARGRLLQTSSGTWSNTARMIRASGTTRSQNGRKSNFSARIDFGAGTIQTLSRSGSGVVRASGVKS